jgi:hypothetical protein
VLYEFEHFKFNVILLSKEIYSNDHVKFFFYLYIPLIIIITIKRYIKILINIYSSSLQIKILSIGIHFFLFPIKLLFLII